MPVSWYDKDGQPISLERWAALLADHKYKRVADRIVGDFWVSTVWLGLDHSIYDSKLIFETMVWRVDDGTPVSEPVRYSTFGAAKAGHDWTVKRLRSERRWDD